MFQVKIHFVALIKDCPASGLDAVDFRKQHGLPEDANNRVAIHANTYSNEALCRQYPEFLDKDANLDLVAQDNDYRQQGREPFFPDSYDSSGKGYITLPSDLIASLLVLGPMPDTALVALLDYRRDEIQAEAKAKAEAKAEREKAAAEREEAKAEAAAKEAAGVAKLRSWAQSHGSDLLKARITEGFAWEELAEAEYAESVFSRLGYTKSDSPGDPTEKVCTTPNLQEIEALCLVRKRITDLDLPATASLTRFVYTPATDPDTYPDEDEEPVRRNEIEISVTVPNGDTRYFYVLPTEVF